MPRSLRSNSVLSLSCSSDDDESVSHEHVSTMLRPLLKRLKKAYRRIDRLESLTTKLANVPEREIPALRMKVESADACAFEVKTHVDGLARDVEDCVSKRQFEALKAELRTELRVDHEKVRELVAEVQARTGAQEALLHGLSSRVESLERTIRTQSARPSDPDAHQVREMSKVMEQVRLELEARLTHN